MNTNQVANDPHASVKALTDVWHELMTRAEAHANAVQGMSATYTGGVGTGRALAELEAARLIEGLIGDPLCQPLTVARQHITQNLFK